jgi:hypothetical protein
MQRYKIRSRTILATWGPAAPASKQQSLQACFIALGRQRPANFGGGESLQITMHRRLTDVATPSNLVLP